MAAAVAVAIVAAEGVTTAAAAMGVTPTAVMAVAAAVGGGAAAVMRLLVRARRRCGRLWEIGNPSSYALWLGMQETQPEINAPPDAGIQRKAPAGFGGASSLQGLKTRDYPACRNPYSGSD